ARAARDAHHSARRGRARLRARRRPARGHRQGQRGPVASSRAPGPRATAASASRTRRSQPAMDFEPSDKCKSILREVERFMEENVYPNERVYQEQLEAGGDPHAEPPVMQEIRAKAKGLGLWNLFLPDPEYGAGLTNLDYAPICEVMGRSPLGARAFNCQAPDTGNAEILAEFGTPEQKRRWLEPLLEDRKRHV